MTAEPPASGNEPASLPAHRRLRELFDAALERPAPERGAWIDANAADAAQCAALHRLLAADGGIGPLETPVDELASRIVADSGLWARSLIGQRIGGFQLLRALGEGGSGAVFLAERESAGFREQVAIKLLRRGLFSQLEQALFRRERQALAALSHPNITRLLDGGVTDTGLLYLVMERVDGVPITDHAREHGLGLTARLRLFESVCRAVAQAHRRLIVHRDIKPSNILVTAAGEAKLLDFGIAKLLDEQAADGTTRSGFAMFTPGYAAPEQESGAPITTATDVYALGVLLHELLLGERPLATTRRPSLRAAQLAARSSPALSAKALRGDLDNILLKAMAPEPERRYGSAAELADDVERFLQRQPVAAHPPSLLYRTRKFVSRHRGGVLLSAAFTLAVLASLAIAAWQAAVARAEARSAQRQAQRAEAIRAFVEDLFRPLHDGTAMAQAPSLPQLLERGVAGIETLEPDDPQVRADLLAMFARIGDAVGETASNRGLAERAARVNAQVHGDTDPRTLDARELFARVLRKLGDYEAAAAELAAVRAAMRARGIAGQRYARLLDGLVALGREQSMDPYEAIALEREALGARLADPAASGDDRLTGFNNLGGAHLYAGDVAQAAAWYGKALPVARATHGDSLDTASVLLNLGQALSAAGRWREASQRYREARQTFARIPIERHPALVTLLIRECGLSIDQEALAAAATVCAQAEAMTRAVHGERHRQYLGLLLRRAQLRMAEGDAHAARSDFEQARDIARGISPEAERRYLLGVVDSAQARAWWLQGDYAVLRDAMLRLLSTDPAQHPRFGARLQNRFHYASLAALACRRAPAPACGDSLASQALAALDETIARGSVLRLPARIALAQAARDRAEAEAALTALTSTLHELDAELAPHHSLRAQAHAALAALHGLRGDAGQQRREAAHAQALLAGLPAGHPLRTQR